MIFYRVWLAVGTPFLFLYIPYIASTSALWHWWSITIITWADGKVTLWLFRDHKVSGGVCVCESECWQIYLYIRAHAIEYSMPPQFGKISSHSNMALLAGRLCKQIVSAGRFSEGWRLYLVSAGRNSHNRFSEETISFFSWTHCMPQYNTHNNTALHFKKLTINCQCKMIFDMRTGRQLLFYLFFVLFLFLFWRLVKYNASSL